jgi:hypothetical protein
MTRAHCPWFFFCRPSDSPPLLPPSAVPQGLVRAERARLPRMVARRGPLPDDRGREPAGAPERRGAEPPGEVASLARRRGARRQSRGGCSCDGGSRHARALRSPPLRRAARSVVYLGDRWPRRKAGRVWWRAWVSSRIRAGCLWTTGGRGQ